MKRYNLINVFFVIQVFCAVSLALESPIGDPTVPPSSVRSGLVRSPNPVDTSGNFTVTGNVSGGSQFRGLVPYHSPTEFQGSMGTSDLSSFLRRSAPMNLNRNQVTPQPYYLPSSTVSSINRGGASGLITYSSIRENNGTGYFAAPAVTKNVPTGISNIPEVLPIYESDLTRPLSYKSRDLERIVNYDLMTREAQNDLKAALQKAGEIKRRTNLEVNLPAQALQKDKSIPSIPEPIKPMEKSKPLEPLQPGEVRQELAKAQKAPSIYEQMLKEVSPEKAAEIGETKKSQIEQEYQTDKIEDPNAGGFRSDLSQVGQETAEATKGVYETFATLSNDKFNYYMRSAEELLKQGQYYRAADAYTLASIYKPNDPLAYAGRAHALFASGEYMSSAYYLTMAINMFPQYVGFKVDLNAMIPDKDRLESRIADVKQWAEKNNSPELSFLLAYIYHQLGKDDEAAKAINIAAEKLPDSEAVKGLKQAIEKK